MEDTAFLRSLIGKEIKIEVGGQYLCKGTLMGFGNYGIVAKAESAPPVSKRSMQFIPYASITRIEAIEE